MLPGKRSIEYKLPKVRRFVNAQILYKSNQFYQSQLRQTAAYERVFEI
jgi:hypothetical protein